jgi:hypothetical protein
MRSEPRTFPPDIDMVVRNTTPPNTNEIMYFISVIILLVIFHRFINFLNFFNKNLADKKNKQQKCGILRIPPDVRLRGDVSKKWV